MLKQWEIRHRLSAVEYFPVIIIVIKSNSVQCLILLRFFLSKSPWCTATCSGDYEAPLSFPQ